MNKRSEKHNRIKGYILSEIIPSLFIALIFGGFISIGLWCITLFFLGGLGVRYFSHSDINVYAVYFIEFIICFIGLFIYCLLGFEKKEQGEE
jgi:uncharacterized membrane protein YjjP (DUF1212 family)